MKLYICLIISVVFAISTGCKKENIDSYNGETGIYFAVRYGDPRYSNNTPDLYAYQPYTELTFQALTGNQTTLNLRVAITGKAVDYDRRFVVVVDKDSTTAIENTNYEPLQNEYLVKANETYADIPVVLKRADNLKTQQVILGLRLKENDQFKLTMPVWKPVAGLQTSVVGDSSFDATYHAVKISDIIVSAPAIWKTYGYLLSGKDAGYWGVFSTEKYYLMCQLCSLTIDDFTSTAMNSDRALLVANIMKKYLIEQYNAKNYVLEKDKRLMWVAGVSWSSVIGVPFVP